MRLLDQEPDDSLMDVFRYEMNYDDGSIKVECLSASTAGRNAMTPSANSERNGALLLIAS